MTNVIAETDEREYWDAALDSVGKYLGVDRWCIHLEVEKGKKVMRLGTKNNYSLKLQMQHNCGCRVGKTIEFNVFIMSVRSVRVKTWRCR